MMEIKGNVSLSTLLILSTLGEITSKIGDTHPTD